MWGRCDVIKLGEDIVDDCPEGLGRVVDAYQPLLHLLSRREKLVRQPIAAVHKLCDALEVTTAFCVPFEDLRETIV